MNTPENPNDDQPAIPVAELQQTAEKATPIYFTLLIYLSVLILGVLVAIALIDNPKDRPSESGPPPSEPKTSTDLLQDNASPVSLIPLIKHQESLLFG